MNDLIPCVGFMGFFVLIFGTIALFRWFRHREILKLAEQGLLPEQYARYMSASRGQGQGLLGGGIVLAALGLALMLGLWPIGAIYGGYPFGFGPWMLVGLLPLFLGLALLITHVLVRKEVSKDSTPEVPSEEKVELLDD